MPVCNGEIRRGKLILISRTGPAHAVYFGAYELVKEAAGGNAQDGKHHPVAAAASGASATIASDALMNPFDGMSRSQYIPAHGAGHNKVECR